jgi:serine-type D-Ala-D-Ala carboxypeptidase
VSLRVGDPEEVGMSAERIDHLRRLAKSWVDEGQTPALVVLAARKGVIVLHEAFGRLGPAPDAPPLALDAIFPIASVTKPITATAVMILVEDGLLGLNRPVQEYIPEFIGEGKDQLMVHHLLTHTSGLNDLSVAEYARDKCRRGELSAPPDWLEDELESAPIIYTVVLAPSLYDAPLWKPPGQEMCYSVMGYEILGEIVRRISGESLETFARRRIFEPLGMRDTSYVWSEEKRHRVVTRAVNWFDDLLGSPRLHRNEIANSSVLSTAADLAAFGQMFLEGGRGGGTRVLSPASVGEMTRNQIPGVSSEYFGQSFPEASWSYGWSVDADKKSLASGSLPSQQVISHDGMNTVFLWIDLAYDLVGVYLTVVKEQYPRGQERWNADLFANAVTAAVVGV